MAGRPAVDEEGQTQREDHDERDREDEALLRAHLAATRALGDPRRLLGRRCFAHGEERLAGGGRGPPGALALPDLCEQALVGLGHGLGRDPPLDPGPALLPHGDQVVGPRGEVRHGVGEGVDVVRRTARPARAAATTLTTSVLGSTEASSGRPAARIE